MIKNAKTSVKQWRDSYRNESILQFTWVERLKILYGIPVRVTFRLDTQLILGETRCAVDVHIPTLAEYGDKSMGPIELAKSNVKESA